MSVEMVLIASLRPTSRASRNCVCDKSIAPPRRSDARLSVRSTKGSNEADILLAYVRTRQLISVKYFHVLSRGRVVTLCVSRQTAQSTRLNRRLHAERPEPA